VKRRWPWSRRSPAKTEFGGSAGGSRKGLGLGRRVEVTAAFLGILVAGVVLAPVVEGVFDHGFEARLEVAEATVSNLPASYSSGRPGEIRQDPETEPTVAATVRNRGTDTAWIEEARIEVVAAARIETCVSQGGGDVPSSKRYRIALPAFPGSKRQVIHHDLHVEVQPGHGVRPVLSFQQDSPASTNLYAIRVQLVADPGGRLIDIGRFVIGVPEPVSRSGQVLPENDEVLLGAASSPHSPYQTWCFRHNLEAMRKVIAEPGRRSDYVAALSRVQVAPAWDSYADRRPIREMVEDLLGGDYPEAPMLAIEAASHTGDPAYEEAIHERAVSRLLRQAERELEGKYGSGLLAVEAAERVLSLGPSSVASRLLSRAKARERAEDERFREEAEAEELESG
jgi:hypothetical protein